MATSTDFGRIRTAVSAVRPDLGARPAAPRFERRVLAFAVGVALLPLSLVPSAHAEVPANTLPTGGQYAYGAGSITQLGSNALHITQTTDKGTINWQSFSIGSGASVNFTQPSASSITLNRVLGNNPSEIFGRMTANGQVFLSNPNGILFAPGASVDVGALFATTLTISDQDAAAGRYTKWTNPGNSGSVVNQGSIITANGYTALAGPQVRNDGLIVARTGSVTLAAGNQVSLDMVGDGLIKVAVDEAALNASVINSGTIQADGGNVLLTARSANALLDTVISNTGEIRANSMVERDGYIELDGGRAGVVSNSGTLQAAGTDAGTTGGTVKVLGDKVGLFDGSLIDVSGNAGGGTAKVGGDFHGEGPEQNASMTYVGTDALIQADAIASGNGGNVAVWSNDRTKFLGKISARGGAQDGDGGFVEVSGAHGLTFAGAVDTRASNGTGGTLLLDPDDITILAGDNTYSGGTDLTASGGVWLAADDPGAQSIGDQFISGLLATTSVSLTASATITANAGVVISWANANTLTLNAGTNITLNDATFTSATGGVSLNVGQGGASGTLDLGTSDLTGVASAAVASGAAAINSTLSRSGGNTWNLTGADAGNLAGVGAASGDLGFAGFGNLADGGAAMFNMHSGGADGSVAGNISAAAGSLNYAGYTTPITFDLAGAANQTTAVSGTVSGISSVTGSSNSDTITGLNESYNLTAVNGGNNGTVSWTSFENLTDAGTGTFNVATAGSISGNLNGGTAGNLSYASHAGPVTLDLSGTGTTGVGGTVSGIRNVTGSGVSDTVTGASETYNLTGLNTGDNGTYFWTSFENLTDTGTGTFNINTGGSISGNLNGGTNGTISYAANAGPVTLDLSSVGFSGVAGTVSGISNVDGSASTSDLVTGVNQTYNLTGSDGGNNGTYTWTGFENLIDTGTGTFNVATAGSISGDLDGGTNGNLSYASHAGPVTLDLSGTGTTGVGGTVTGIRNVTGSGASDTVTGASQTYNLTGVNAGDNGTYFWTSFENLSDTGTGTFNVATAGSISGNLNGGGAGNLSYTSHAGPVTLDLSGTGTTGVGGTVSGIRNVTGSGASDTVTGASETYNLTGVNAGDNGTYFWTSFENLTDTGTGTFNLNTGGSISGNLNGGTNGTISYAGNAGPVTLNLSSVGFSGVAGTVSGISNVDGSASTSDLVTGVNQTYDLTGSDAGNNGTYTWTGFENLSDTGTGTFNVATAGSISGDLDGGMNGNLSYASHAGPVTLDLSGTGTTGVGGTVTGIRNVTGSGASDTVTGASQTYNLTGVNAGDNGTYFWTSFENLIDTGTGTFNVATAGSISGNLNGGATGNLSYASHAGPVTLDLSGTGTTGVGGTVTGIRNVTGSGASDTVTGASETYNLTGASVGNNGTYFWTSFENLTDTGTGTFLMHSGADGSISGNLNGGTNGTISYSGYTSGVTLNLAGNGFSGIGGTVSGISDVVGSSNADTVTGINETYNLTGANSGDNGTYTWNSFENLIDNGTGTFNVATAASISGNLDGGANGNLSYASHAGPVTLNLSGIGSTGIDGSVSGIRNVTGSANAGDLVTGSNGTYTMTGANAGNDGSYFWTAFENLADTSGGDFIGAGGSVSGSISGGAGATTLTGNITSTGAQTYIGAVTLSGATNLTSSGGSAITLAGTVTGAQSLAVNTTGATTFGGQVDIGSLSTDANGTSSSVGVTTSGTTVFNDNTTLSGTYTNTGFTASGTTTLAAATTVNAGSGAATFTGAVNGAFALNVNSSTLESFGSTIDVASVTTDAPGTVSLGGAVTTTGDQTFNDQVNAGAITLTAGGAVVAGNTLNDFTGAVTLNAATASVADANGLVVLLNTAGGTSLTAGLALSASGSSGSLATVSGSGTSFGALDVSGNLSVNSGGAVAQGGAMNVSGTTAINAGASSVTLTLGNDFAGAVSITAGTTQITDANTLTLGTLNTGALTVINTGALNLGAGSVNGALAATSNGGSITQAAGITITGTSNIAAGAGSITLAASNDFGGAVTASGAGGITLHDINGITPASISAGTGAVSLTAGAINAGGPIDAGSLTLGSNSNVVTVTFQTSLAGKDVLLTGNATSWTFCDFNGCGTSMTPPVFSKTNPGSVDIFFNGVNLGSSATTISNVVGSIGGTVSQIAAQALEEALDTDSVQKQIDYGFAGDVGTTPPMDHRIDETGISTPQCFEESRDGEPCRSR